MGLFDFFKAKIESVTSSNFQRVNSKQINNKPRKLKYFDQEYNNLVNNSAFNLKEAVECLNNNACISCGSILDSQIKGNRKCPSCQKKIYVRSDVYSKQKVELCDGTIKDFEKYDKKVREILFCERIMKNKEYIYQNYMQDFLTIKSRNINVRDIMWQFANKIGSDLDNDGYKIFMKASLMNKHDRVLENFNAIRCLDSATQEYVTMYEIANYENKKEIALNLLAHIAYRDIQIVALDEEGDAFRTFTEEEYLSKVHSAIIIEFLEKNKYDIEYFKQVFIEIRHPFILPRLSNEDTWEYIEKSLKVQIKWNNKNK